MNTAIAGQEITISSTLYPLVEPEIENSLLTISMEDDEGVTFSTGDGRFTLGSIRANGTITVTSAESIIAENYGDRTDFLVIFKLVTPSGREYTQTEKLEVSPEVGTEDTSIFIIMEGEPFNITGVLHHLAGGVIPTNSNETPPLEYLDYKVTVADKVDEGESVVASIDLNRKAPFDIQIPFSTSSVFDNHVDFYTETSGTLFIAKDATHGEITITTKVDSTSNLTKSFILTLERVHIGNDEANEPMYLEGNSHLVKILDTTGQSTVTMNDTTVLPSVAEVDISVAFTGVLAGSPVDLILAVIPPDLEASNLSTNMVPGTDYDLAKYELQLLDTDVSPVVITLPLNRSPTGEHQHIFDVAIASITPNVVLSSNLIKVIASSGAPNVDFVIPNEAIPGSEVIFSVTLATAIASPIYYSFAVTTAAGTTGADVALDTGTLVIPAGSLSANHTLQTAEIAGRLTDATFTVEVKPLNGIGASAAKDVIIKYT